MSINSEDLLRRTTFAGSGGLKIAADIGGPEGAPLVCLAHGGGQTRHSWKETAQNLINWGYRVVSIDLRGHGESAWSPDVDYGLPAFAGDMEAVVTAMGAETGLHLIGASLGGLTSLVVAPRLASTLRSIVLVDVVPRVDSSGRTRIQRFTRAHLAGFATLQEAAEAVAAYRPEKPRPLDPLGLMKNLREGDDGRLYWHWDPARLERSPTLNIDLIESSASQIRCPVLLIWGTRSDVVNEQGVEALREMLPQLEVIQIDNADHMVVGDDNTVFAGGLMQFLDRAGQPR